MTWSQSHKINYVLSNSKTLKRSLWLGVVGFNVLYQSTNSSVTLWWSLIWDCPLNFYWKRTKAHYSNAVWPDGSFQLLKFLPFTIMKLRPKAKFLMPKKVLNFDKYQISPQKMPKIPKFCRGGEISPNLVTLLKRHNDSSFLGWKNSRLCLTDHAIPNAATPWSEKNSCRLTCDLSRVSLPVLLLMLLLWFQINLFLVTNILLGIQSIWLLWCEENRFKLNGTHNPLWLIRDWL